MKYIAHKRSEADAEGQSIIDHLKGTARRCSDFARPLGEADYAYVMAMLHDIGKYSNKFQERINGKNIAVEHSASGALIAYKNKLLSAMFCIAGHHAGIPDFGSPKIDTADAGTMCGKLKRKPEDFSSWTSEQPQFNPKGVKEPVTAGNFSHSFLTRMLFSCLVDADFLDTEEYMSEKGIVREGGEPLEALLDKLNKYISKWASPQKGSLNEQRSKMLNRCIEAGKSESSRLFSLTMPTGSGKTVSSLAFALNYAVKNGKKRIIYVIPYTSIIEQNAEVFRRILGDDNVLEHHSNIDASDESEGQSKKLLACENWDSPVIVTTAVQFFESLFSNRPGKCRKLHNIAESVVIFDEAQMLPVDFLYPCVCAMWQLTRLCNTAVVMCTATQPNLDPFFGKAAGGAADLEIKEICSGLDKSANAFRRVEFKLDGKLDDDELAKKLSEEEQVLCIVNKKAHAQRLYDMLESNDGSFHLSTYMYPLHRKRVIDEIRQRLAQGEECRVISTSLIEAGVDVDFPTVFRAISGLDSILQAAGRCNREGRRPAEESIVHIFDTDEVVSRQELNVVTAREVFKEYKEEIYKNEAVKRYFDKLYNYMGSAANAARFDKKQIVKKLEGFRFKEAARDFKLIDGGTMTVYIPADGNEAQIAALRSMQYSKDLFDSLRGYCVNLYDSDIKRLDDVSALEIIDQSFAILTDKKYYNKNKGLIIPDGKLGRGIFVD